jgi:hypothetical protein
MTVLVDQAAGSLRLKPVRLPLAAVSFFCAAAVYAFSHWISSGQLTRPVDNDDIVRLAVVRELMAGQSWYDGVLYRLGTNGTQMHWSRLIDAPIAFLIWLGNLIMPGKGEDFAAHAWPMLLLGVGLSGFAIAVRRIAPQFSLLQILISGSLGLILAGKFDQGSFDHHNVQQALSVWLVALACPSPRPRRDGIAAGLLAAVMLAVGIETLPFLAAFGIALGGCFLFQTGHDRDFFQWFGLSLAGSVVLLFVLLVPASDFSASTCDAFSTFHLTLAVCGGASLALLAAQSRTDRTWKQRFAGLVPAGFLTVGVVALLHPACLRNPLAELPPLVVTHWLSRVNEVASAYSIFSDSPWEAILILGMPCLAICVSVRQILANRARTAHIILLATMLAGFAVTLWQVRGNVLLLPISVITLTVWPGLMPKSDAFVPTIKRALAWLSSCTLGWHVATVLAMTAFPLWAEVPAQKLTPIQNCTSKDAYAGLAKMEPAMVLGVSNTGPSVLAFTKHRTLAGPYHRNPEGLLHSIEAMIGTSMAAEAIIRQARIDLVIACVEGREDNRYANTAPDGFIANLLKGRTPDFLEPVAWSAGQPLRIWRVRPQK